VKPRVRVPNPLSRRLTAALEAWFAQSARDLPWRSSPRDPYHALVAEAMLQQTQVSRVVAYFQRFIARFPHVQALAGAPEADVMALWAGLGYYRRARCLHAAAMQIVNVHSGRVPDDANSLRALPGVGPYSAGSIASIVFGRHEPIVDGNVQRVLMRLYGHDVPPSTPAARDWAWEKARQLVHAASDPAAFNEGLMELGATVCLPTPAQPRCGQCPWHTSCAARRTGREAEIPSPKPRARKRRAYFFVVVLRDARERVLLQRRGTDGLWPGLWQPPTLEARSPISAADRKAFLQSLPSPMLKRHASARFTRTLTHLQASVDVVAFALDRAGLPRTPIARRSVGLGRWAHPSRLSVGISSLHAQAFASVGVSLAPHSAAPLSGPSPRHQLIGNSRTRSRRTRVPPPKPHP
jgi:A/G-specific adenine glycosylase